MPQGNLGAELDGLSVPCAAKVESCCSSSVLLQAGHWDCFDPKTMASNLCPQPLQMYSKIGITTSEVAPRHMAETMGNSEADTFIIRVQLAHKAHV